MKRKKKPVILFEDFGLPEYILKGFSALGYTRTTLIQKRVIPEYLNTKKNIIAFSQSGTGKTACISIFSLLAVDTSNENLQVLIISPTIESSSGLSNHILTTGKFRQEVIVRSTYEIRGRRRISPLKCHIFCGTPGFTVGLLRRRKIKLDSLKLLILEEADSIISQKTNALKDHIVRIKKHISSNARICLFSNTFELDGGGFENQDYEEVERIITVFANEIVPDPKMLIKVGRERFSLNTMCLYYILADGFDEKMEVINQIYSECTIGQAIIYTNSRKTTEMIGRTLMREGHCVSVLHSSLSLKERRSSLEKFRKNETKVLVSTHTLRNSVPTVSLIINFGLPISHQRESEPDYGGFLHRVGKTCQFGGFGVSLSLVEKENEFMIKKLEEYFNTNIQRIREKDIEYLMDGVEVCDDEESISVEDEKERINFLWSKLDDEELFTRTWRSILKISFVEKDSVFQILKSLIAYF